MGLSPYDKKRYKESKRRRRQAILQSETGYIVPYRRSKKPLVIGICALAIAMIAAVVIAIVSACNSKPVSSASVSNEIESGDRLRVVNRANRLDEDYKPSLVSINGVEVHKGIADALEQLTKAAAEKGVGRAHRVACHVCAWRTRHPHNMAGAVALILRTNGKGNKRH